MGQSTPLQVQLQQGRTCVSEDVTLLEGVAVIDAVVVTLGDSLSVTDDDAVALPDIEAEGLCKQEWSRRETHMGELKACHANGMG